MTDIRPAAVAGYFYPDHKPQLIKQIEGYLADAPSSAVASRAIIAPHAGYEYSAPIAAHAYQAILSEAERFTRVVVLGPAHRVYVSGMALSSASGFATPLGTIPLDHDIRTRLLQQPDIAINDAAHQPEHSIEVQLPFLQHLLKSFSLTPIVVGDASAESVSRLIAGLWDDDTLMVISSDLSHFLDYDSARHQDQQTTRAIERCDIDAIGPNEACGCRPVNGLLQFAQSKEYRVTTLDLRNSGDTAGSKDRVVGYGAYAIA